MGAQGPIMTADPGRRIRLRLGLGFLIVGFLGHFLAARAIGGSYVAYRDHMLGFYSVNRAFHSSRINTLKMDRMARIETAP